MSRSTEHTKVIESTDFEIPPIPLDIEHMPVENDPRTWSAARKNVILVLISTATTIAGLSNGMQNPAVAQIEKDLSATSAEFSLSIAVFALGLGIIPLAWTSISEVKGRKVVYVSSLTLCMVGTILAAVSKSIQLLIGSRALQAAGASAFMSIGAATLADVFDPIERGTKMGIYYVVGLVGMSIGPILGGALTVTFNWRATFWFLAIQSGILTLAFLFFFKDTFRRERSHTYQNVLKQRLRSASTRSSSVESNSISERNPRTEIADLEKRDPPAPVRAAIELSLRDVNPFKPIIIILRQWNNVAMLIATGMMYGFTSLILYATARTLDSKYQYSALKIGLVSVSYGVGCIAGSLLGGRWSDYVFAKLKAANGDVSIPEMRLQGAVYSAFITPACSVGLGWVYERHLHVSVVCTMLFLCGFFVSWTYANTLAYLADANIGRTFSAFAMNSVSRGTSAFMAVEVVVPLQDGVGDGWTYTIWGGLMLMTACLVLLVSWRGTRWRMQAEAREAVAADPREKE